jgi:hypothetical protein
VSAPTGSPSTHDDKMLGGCPVQPPRSRPRDRTIDETLSCYAMRPEPPSISMSGLVFHIPVTNSKLRKKAMALRCQLSSLAPQMEILRGSF